MKKFMNSLYGKISLIFLVLLVLLGAAQIFLSIHFSSDFITESDQKLNRFLAQDLAKKFKPYLQDSLNYGGIEHSFHEMMVMNPRVEFYLIDQNGDLLAYFAEPEKIKRMRVDMGPIRKFLAAGEDLQMPLFGDDPRSPNRKKPFSVTPIDIGHDKNGYLYVILGGELYDSATSMVEDSYILRTGAVAIALNFVITALAGLLLFFLLTKRLRRITESVKEFEQGNYQTQIQFKSGDEIGQLSNAFNKMAQTIHANVEEIKNNDKMRRDLIANISHDLRSPLASIQGYLETVLMKDQEMSAEERHKYLETVYKNINRLNKLVYELFELSKLDAKQVKPELEQFPISELVQDVVLKFKPKAAESGVELMTGFPEKTPIAQGDIGMIERALSNLIDNAISYTSSGGKVSVSVDQNNRKVFVTVKDTGKGIPEKDLPHVFERFYRADKSRSGEGTGLGLAITKKIIEAHESDITVKSETDRGSEFRFSLNCSG